MTQQFTIEGRLPGLNEYIAAMNHNRFTGNKMKTEYTEQIAWRCKSLTPFQRHVTISFSWFEPNARRDPDNFTSFGRKLILDGMVKGGLLPDDSQKWIGGWTDLWGVDAKNPRIVIKISEVDNEISS